MFHYYGQDWSKELISAHLLVPTSVLSDTYQRRSGLLKTCMPKMCCMKKKRRENTQHRWSGCNSKYLDTTYTFSGMFHHSKYNSRSYNMYFLVLEFFSVISNAPNSRTTFPHQKSLFLTLNVQAMGKMGGSFLELVTSRAGRYKACAFFGTKLTIIEPLTTENECLEFLWPSVRRLQREKHAELVILSVFPPKIANIWKIWTCKKLLNCNTNAFWNTCCVFWGL